MLILGEAVIVWTPKGGKAFNNIPLADKYFSEQKDARWQRLPNPFDTVVMGHKEPVYPKRKKK
jgi:hypothetical protein